MGGSTGDKVRGRVFPVTVTGLSGRTRRAGNRRVYNIFGETIAVHTADVGGGKLITVSEVLALIWSMMQAPSP